MSCLKVGRGGNKMEASEGCYPPVESLRDRVHWRGGIDEDGCQGGGVSLYLCCLSREGGLLTATISVFLLGRTSVNACIIHVSSVVIVFRLT